MQTSEEKQVYTKHLQNKTHKRLEGFWVVKIMSSRIILLLNYNSNLKISFEIDHHLLDSLFWWGVHSLTPLFFEELTWLVNKVSLIICLMHHLESITYILEWCTSLTSSGRCGDHWLAGWMASPSCQIAWQTCLSTLLEWYLTAQVLYFLFIPLLTCKLKWILLLLVLFFEICC